jgi:uncharacterized membrane protein
MTDALGPIDYVVLEFPGNHFNGGIVPALLDLVDTGLVRVLDLAFVTKDEDGNVAALELEDLPEDDASALSDISDLLVDLVTEEDLIETGNALQPNSSAMMLVWENSWAGPFVAAIRESGGDVVASGGIPVATLLEALEAQA